MQKKLSNKELVAAGHKFAANISADTPLIDMAKLVSELATQLDAALAAAAEACKQRDTVTAESHIRCNIIGRMIGQYSAAGYHAVQNSMNPAQSLLYDALQALETPATDACLNAVRAGFLPAGLHPSTSELVLTFAKALAEKLHRSEQKYGWSDGWKNVGWQDKCLADFHHHISKGDPRDVAAYCAFMWYHGWPTQSAPTINLNAVRAEGADAAAFKIRKAIPAFKDIHCGAVKECADIAEMVAVQFMTGTAGKDGSHE